MSLFPKKWSVPFKGDFLNVLTFLHPQIPDVQIVSISAKYYPIITIHTSMESLFTQLSCDLYDLY